MDVIGIMLIGVLVGNLFFSKRYKVIIEKIQFFCVIALIFLMGVTLGNTEGLLNDLVNTGVISILYAVIPIVFSIFGVYILTKISFSNKEDEKW